MNICDITTSAKQSDIYHKTNMSKVVYSQVSKINRNEEQKETKTKQFMVTSRQLKAPDKKLHGGP